MNNGTCGLGAHEPRTDHAREHLHRRMPKRSLERWGRGRQRAYVFLYPKYLRVRVRMSMTYLARDDIRARIYPRVVSDLTPPTTVC